MTGESRVTIERGKVGRVADASAAVSRAREASKDRARENGGRTKGKELTNNLTSLYEERLSPFMIRMSRWAKW